MGLDIPDECSKHGVSGLKPCGYRSPLHGSRSGGCAPGLQSGKDLRRWMLGISRCSIPSRSERFSACQKANIGSLQTFAIMGGGGKYPVLYDYWIGVLRVWTLTSIGSGWQTHGKVWRFVRIKLVCPVFYWGKGSHSEIILWSTTENQCDARIKTTEALIVETMCTSGNLISNIT